MSAYTKAYDIRKLEEKIALYEKHCTELRGELDYLTREGRSDFGARVYLAEYTKWLAAAREEKAKLDTL